MYAMPRPLQILAVSLPPGGGPAGRLLAAVDRLHARGGIRVLDMLHLSKNYDGTVIQSSFGEDEDFGSLVTGLFPIGPAMPAPSGELPAQLWAQAQSLPAGSAMAVLLVEHRWARDIFDVVDEEGGALIGGGFLTPELGLIVDAEVVAMEEAAASIAAAQVAEADARLRTAAAYAEAEEAVTASAEIRSAAAAEAVRVLTDVGLVEREALHEAADALNAAGLLVAAADAATAQVLADDEAVAAAADEAATRAVEDDAMAVAAADEVRERALADDALAVAEHAGEVAAADERRADAVQAASITPAEIRVLRYLPTKLTFALIADQLGISREAAKSRAERAYRRLGVHNRADAVQRARELRIIPKKA
jgi:DNA-binding CsgD family transcriptional regulator